MRRPLRLLIAASCIAAGLTGCNDTPADLPDLTITSTPTVSPAAPAAGDAVTVTVPISNTGTVDAGAFDFTVNRDGTPGAFSGQASAGLTAGASGTFTFTPSETTAGNHTYIILINPTNGLAESNYQNNSATLTVSYSAAVPAAGNG